MVLLKWLFFCPAVAELIRFQINSTSFQRTVIYLFLFPCSLLEEPQIIKTFSRCSQCNSISGGICPLISPTQPIFTLSSSCLVRAVRGNEGKHCFEFAEARSFRHDHSFGFVLKSLTCSGILFQPFLFLLLLLWRGVIYFKCDAGSLASKRLQLYSVSNLYRHLVSLVPCRFWIILDILSLQKQFWWSSCFQISWNGVMYRVIWPNIEISFSL